MIDGISKKIKDFKVLVLDADGVIFSGHEYLFQRDSNLEIIKKRSLIDGQGLSFLRSIGVRILIASGETDPLSRLVDKLNSLPSVLSGDWHTVECVEGISGHVGKVDAINGWLQKNGFNWEECAYIGDDVNDYKAMQKAGLKVTPANGTRRIVTVADIVLKKCGGDGAIREFAEMVLDARSIDEIDLSVS